MPRILVADSDPVILTAVTDALQPHGVLTAPDAGKALEKTGRERPDLVVLGGFPGSRCGIAACNGIRNDPRTSRTPVLMLCPGPDGCACRCTADRRLSRPFRLRDLALQVDGLLNPRLPL